jgi:hypothetical protein
MEFVKGPRFWGFEEKTRYSCEKCTSLVGQMIVWIASLVLIYLVWSLMPAFLALIMSQTLLFVCIYSPFTKVLNAHRKT